VRWSYPEVPKCPDPCEEEIMIKLATLGLLAAMCAGVQEKDPAKELKTLIDQLQELTEEGHGYSVSTSGSQFLPLAGTESTDMMLLGKPPTESSLILRKIVERGLAAVPVLLEHLEDVRLAAMKPVSGMLWTNYPDEYDYNRRVMLLPPQNILGNLMKDGIGEPGGHAITVGDLCFVALGQILNRRFTAVRYQASGGLMINSPTFSKALRTRIRAEWTGLTEARHRESLIQDFLKPDHENRRIGAYYRLAYYYPDAVEALVLKQLTVSTFNVFTAQDFARKTLYSTDDKAKRKELFEEFLRKYGPASRDGLLKQLFEDLDTQEAQEEKRTSGTDYVYDHPRRLLIELYGLPTNVRSKDIPWFDTWAETDRARFVKALVYDKSPKIDEAVFQHFMKIQEDDYFALACMTRLLGRGHDSELIAFCERRSSNSKHYGRELEAFRSALMEKRK
jgi:hypothetical protein